MAAAGQGRGALPPARRPHGPARGPRRRRGGGRGVSRHMSLVRGSAFVTGGGPGGGPAYVASKHGVVGLTRQLSITYAARGEGDRELAGEADDAVLGGGVRSEEHT